MIMVTYTSFDPREGFRQGLGTQWDVDGNGKLEWCIRITDKTGEPVYVPIYLTEEIKSEDLPDLPYVEMHIPPDGTHYECHDIKARTRKIESEIKVHIYFADLDNIDRTLFAKKIKDEFHNMVRNNQSTTTGITFMNVQDDGLDPETDGRQVIFHYVATLYCLYYDLC